VFDMLCLSVCSCCVCEGKDRDIVVMKNLALS